MAYKAHDYLIQGCAGSITDEDLHSRAVIFNDLEVLDQMYRPSVICIWAEPKKLLGIEIQYATGNKRSHGISVGPPTHVLSLAHDGSEVIVEVKVQEAVNLKGLSYTRSLSIATSTLNTLDTSISLGTPEAATTEPSKDQKDPSPAQDGENKLGAGSTEDGKEEENKPAKDSANEKKDEDEGLALKYTTWTKPDDTRYSLRGFFGAHHGDAICCLAVVWGRDSFVPVPPARIQQPLCKGFLGISPQLQNNMRGHLTSYAGKFLTGNYIAVDRYTSTDEAAGDVVTTPKPMPTMYFNALDDIDINWRITRLGFASVDNCLTGLMVQYNNGKILKHGSYTKETKRWVCEVSGDLSIVKITAGSLEVDDPLYIDTLEFVRTTPEGGLPSWPMDLSTLRYLGNDDERVAANYSEIGEAAPKVGHDKYSVRGFFGECADGIITKLGVIWGSR